MPPPKIAGFACQLALQPVGVFFGEGARGLVAVGRDALGAGYVDEGVVVGAVRFLGECADVVQLLGRIEEAFVAARDVVVDLDAEDLAGGGVGNNFVRAFLPQTVGANADVVGPVLAGREALRERERRQQKQAGGAQQIQSA